MAIQCAITFVASGGVEEVYKELGGGGGGGGGELKPISPSSPSTAYDGFLASFVRYSFIDASMNDRVGYVRTCICNDVCSTNDAAFFSDAERERN